MGGICEDAARSAGEEDGPVVLDGLEVFDTGIFLLVVVIGGEDDLSRGVG